MNTIKEHKYDVIGGYKNYCNDLSSVMRQYEATEGLGVEVNLTLYMISDLFPGENINSENIRYIWIYP